MREAAKKMNKNSNIARENRLAAMRIAELNATDKEDLIACVSDMQRTASLEKDEAVAVANAIRAKYLPNLAKQAGVVLSELNLEDGIETVDFANDESDDEEIEFHHFQDEEGDEDETEDFDDLEDNDEEEDSDDVATFEIEVPADMVDAAQKAVQEALDNLLGGDDDSEDDMDMEDESYEDSDEDSDDESDDESDEDYDDSEEDMDSEDDEVFMKNSNEVRKMTRQALAERKAQREALLRRAEREEILKKFASEEETYPASASFKYNEDLVNMQGEVDYPSMSLDNDGSNSLKEENPTWAEQRVPTVNPGSLQFPDVTKPSKFDGAGDGSLEYTVDWDSLENPSEGLDADMFEVPTQMPSMPHKTTKTVAASREEESEVQCTTCGSMQRMTEAQMNDQATRCSNKDCASNKDAEDEEEVTAQTDVNTGDAFDAAKRGADLVRKVNDGAGKATEQLSQGLVASVDSARIKAAYSCSSKLVLAGIITSDEVDSYAEQMLNDNLKVDSMIRQTKLLLKSAQSSTERVAAAAAERMGSVRTASNLGVSTAPAFSGGHTANGAALDIQSALKGTWTMPNIED